MAYTYINLTNQEHIMVMARPGYETFCALKEELLGYIKEHADDIVQYVIEENSSNGPALTRNTGPALTRNTGPDDDEYQSFFSGEPATGFTNMVFETLVDYVETSPEIEDIFDAHDTSGFELVYEDYKDETIVQNHTVRSLMFFLMIRELENAYERLITIQEIRSSFIKNKCV